MCFFQYCLTVLRLGFKSKTIYRMSAWLGSISSVTTFLIQIMIWWALLGTGERFGTTFEMMLTYSVLTQMASAFVASFSGQTISTLIQTGDISAYLVRPLKLKRHLFLDDFGKNLFDVLLLNLPVCLLLVLFGGFSVPDDPWVIVTSAIMLINGMVMLFHYRYILGMLSFWLIKNPFTSWGFQNAESVFSGKFLPLWLCPQWLDVLSQFLPFRYFTYAPVALFVGKEPLSSAGQTLVIQFVWIAFLVGLEKLVSTKAYKKLIVQGG